MPLLSFEGVDVDVPTSLTGVQFAFTNGTLTIQCQGFTGNIVMSKPVLPTNAANPPMTLGDFPSVVSSASAPVQKVLSGPSPAKKRTLADEIDDFSTDSECDPRHKRARSNSTTDADRSLLLTQLEASQQSAQDSSAETESIHASSTTSSSETTAMMTQTSELASTETKTTPAKATKGKKASSTPRKNVFSPETKEHAIRKTPDSTAKRGRTVKSKADTSTQPSIRDLMLQAATPNASTAPRASLTAKWATITADGEQPIGRWGHSVTRISEDRVVLYGGTDDDEATLGDLHVFDLNKHTWSRPLNCESAPRTWHDAVYLESKHLMLVLGGERTTSDGELEVLSDVMVLDTECFLWYPPAISGSAPVARSGHTCTAVGNDVVVFGGSRGRTRQTSIHVLDTDNWHWKNVKVEGKPPTACTYHSAVTMGDSVVFFGGNDNKQCYNAVDVLQRSADGETWTWFHPCVVGTAPCVRTGHSATVLDATRILIFGGWDPHSDRPPSTTVSNDAFVLDTKAWEWDDLRIETSETDEKLLGRVGHRAVLADDRTLVLFGGQSAQEERLHVIHSVTITSTEATAVATS